MEPKKSFPTNNAKASSQIAKDNYFSLQKNDKGFVMVMLVSLVPLLMSLSFAIVGYSQFSFIKLKALNLCRQTLLSGQDQIKNELTKLLKMNPRAKTLRKWRKNAKMALQAAKASRNPKAIAAATIALNLVKFKQKLFAAKQKLTLLNARRIGFKYKNKLHSKFKQVAPNIKAKISGFPFAVEKVQKETITPDYRVKRNFSNQQKVSASWQIKNYNFNFINSFIDMNQSPDIIGYCHASLKKEGLGWQAFLMKKGIL